MRRRDFITVVAGSAVWPLAAYAQSPLPIVAFIRDGSADNSARLVAAFRNGLNETGYVEGKNVAIEYYWLEGRYDHLPKLLAELVRRNVSVLATPGNVVSLAAKTATTTIPIVFGVGEDPVGLGLVASLARPGGNATGINFFVQEVVAKRLKLLHELIPHAVRIAVLVNPGSASITEATIRAVQEAAPAFGMQIQIVKATTVGEIDTAFDEFARDRPDALFVAPDGLFTISRRVQLATLTARERIPTSHAIREPVEVGGLMSYGTDLAETFRLIGVYVGNILKGAKPADLPVLQSTKFELVINLQTARALGIQVPPGIISITDAVIE